MLAFDIFRNNKLEKGLEEDVPLHNLQLKETVKIVCSKDSYYLGEIRKQVLLPFLVARIINVKYGLTFNMEKKCRKCEKAFRRDIKTGTKSVQLSLKCFQC